MHADEHQSLQKLALSFLMEEAIYVKSTQNSNLVIYLQYIEKESVVTACVTYCDSKHSNILQGSSRFRCCLALNGCGLKWAQPFKTWNYKI